MTKIFNPKDWLAVPEQKEVPNQSTTNRQRLLQMILKHISTL